jgi:hypothetical protein
MSKPKHSKFRNTGILFELLTRQITADILANKDKSEAKDILFKYFSENKELGKEWQLYHFLLNEKVKNESQADKYINIVLSKRLRLNGKKLSEEKYELIKEIKDTYSIEDFLKSSIKNYKIHASIYKLFEDTTNKTNKFDINEVIQSRNCITEYLCECKKNIKKTDESLINLYKQQNEDIRILSYKILLDSMNEKYKNLDDDQKNILREYINNISNTNDLNEIVLGEFIKLKNKLTEVKDKIDNDIVKIKINETVNQLDKVKLSKGVKDNHIMAILLGYELLKEVKNKIV